MLSKVSDGVNSLKWSINAKEVQICMMGIQT